MKRTFSIVHPWIASLLFVITILPGVAMPSDELQSRVNEAVLTHSISYPLQGSAVEFSFKMETVCKQSLYGEAFGLSTQDLKVISGEARNRNNKDVVSRNVLLPFFTEIRQRLSDRSATTELAQLLMDARRAEELALEHYYRDLYSKLTPDGKNRVDAAMNDIVIYDRTVSELDFVGLAAEVPEVVHSLLMDASDRFFKPPKPEDMDYELNGMKVSQHGDMR